ncbi:MAG: lipopolysaccharide heptosyltransferase I [Pseudohongiella sp.]|nr:lipopolysaccharide heptosyltransferase I [Pseudohongiella sp.]
MRILIVKTSSLGDVLHTLPALTDAMQAIPGLKADWVVEEGFAEIPAWHPAVDKVIPVAIRRWRKQVWHSLRSGEFKHFASTLRAQDYDHVIDAQGLLKSAVITRLARGVRSGLDKNSIKEAVASRFYHQRFAVPRALHAVQRVRQLFAAVLGYQYNSNQIDYGLSDFMPTDAPEQVPGLMFLHGTTWASKHWPEVYWRELASLADQQGFKIKLPWGNPDEQQRAGRIAEGITGALVLGRQSLTELARHLSHCSGVVAVDTGLGHLAAALGRPTVSIYGATNPGLSGSFGHFQHHLTSSLACSPCMRRECAYRGQAMMDNTAAGTFEIQPACYRSMPPSLVFSQLQRLMLQSGTEQKSTIDSSRSQA